ncbi:MAG: hypothetical protein DDT30_01479 [Dehalococcoidia bacterium]|nr:hypothetical protein [Bacillota bacterium]
MRHQDNHCTSLEWLAETSFTTVSLGADVSGDRKVDAADPAAVATAFNSVPDSLNWNPAADLNNDGQVDIFAA